MTSDTGNPLLSYVLLLIWPLPANLNCYYFYTGNQIKVVQAIGCYYFLEFS